MIFVCGYSYIWLVIINNMSHTTKILLKPLTVITLFVLLLSCEKEKSENSSPLVGWGYTFELVDSSGGALAYNIADLPFDTGQAYFKDMLGRRFSLQFEPPCWCYMNPQWNYDSLGNPLGGIPDSIGVGARTYMPPDKYYDYEDDLSHFTWYIYLNSDLPPDTFVVYAPRPGGVADSATINGRQILPAEANADGTLIPGAAGQSMLVHNFPLYYP